MRSVCQRGNPKKLERQRQAVKKLHDQLEAFHKEAAKQWRDTNRSLSNTPNDVEHLTMSDCDLARHIVEKALSPIRGIGFAACPDMATTCRI